MGMALDELNKYGIGKMTINLLKKKLGIKYLRELSLYNAEELESYAGINVERAEKILRIARSLSNRVKISTISETKIEKEVFTTGIESLDILLGGGIWTKELTEFAGEFGSGKTQLCHQLAVTVQLPIQREGLSGSCLYIDTEGTFSSSRIEKIAKRFEIDNPLENIFYARPLTVGDLEDIVIKNVSEFLRDKNVKLIIIDSIIALYRAQFKGMEWLARRQQRINYVLDWLKRYSNIYNIAVVYTNQVVVQPVPFGIAIKSPTGGNIVAHAATHRFFLKKRKDFILIECLDSPRISRGATAQFTINREGCIDYQP
ncbi:MAG: DNA repair and recombination protein RadA [Thermoprotei archaeon]|nr:MAG: DNA repair and recombination protein RadA [Thermoprotei archaeon]